MLVIYALYSQYIPTVYSIDKITIVIIVHEAQLLSRMVSHFQPSLPSGNFLQFAIEDGL